MVVLLPVCFTHVVIIILFLNNINKNFIIFYYYYCYFMHTFKHIKLQKDMFGRPIKTYGNQVGYGSYDRNGQSYWPPGISTAVDEEDKSNLNYKEISIVYTRWCVHLNNTSTRTMPYVITLGRETNILPDKNFQSDFLQTHSTYAPPALNPSPQVSTYMFPVWISNREVNQAIDPDATTYDVTKTVTGVLGPLNSVNDQTVMILEDTIPCHLRIKDDKFTRDSYLNFLTDSYGTLPCLNVTSWYGAPADSSKSQINVICQFWYVEKSASEKLF